MALTIDKIKNINIPINVSRKPDNYPPSTRGISLYNDSVNLYDAISLFMASAPPATFNIGEGLLGNGSVLSPLSWAGVNHTAALSGNGSVGSPLDVADKGITLSKLAQSGATLNQIIKWDGTNWVPANETGGATSFVPLSRELTINGVTYDLSQNRSWTINSMVYPSAGIPVSTGSAWGTSIVNNSTNWNTAFSWGNHALAGYLTSAAIGVTVQPYNANTVIDGSYVHTDNNYTTAEKSKLAGIQAGAEVNVNADWNAVSGDAQILNKPSIPLVDSVPTSGSTNAVSSGSVFTALSFKADLVGGKVPAIQLPSYVDDVLEGYYNGTSFFIDSGFSIIMTPETGKIYINLLNNTSYRYTGSVYVQISNTVSSLNDLTDVTIGTLNNGQILQYNGTTSQWENVSVTIGSGDMQKSVYDIDNDGVVDYAETISVTVRNTSSTDILRRGTIVYLSGSTGNRPNAFKAQANSEATSSGTFGVVVNDINTNGDGLVAAMGTLHNLDTRTGAGGNPNPFTSDTLLDGDILWLDPTTAGYVTKTKPSAPDHAVFIGIVAATSPTNGRIVYKIQNGYEIEELHNVKITSPLLNNQVLRYNDSNSLWENKTLNFQTPLTLTTTGTSGVATLAGDGTLNIPNYSTVPGGSTTQVQFNDAGSFGGAAGFTYDKTAFTNTGQLNIGSPSSPTGRLNIKGGGNDTTTISLRITNSLNTEVLRMTDAGSLLVGAMQFNGLGENVSLTGQGFATPGTNRTMRMFGGNNNNATDVAGVIINSGTISNRTASSSFQGVQLTSDLQTPAGSLTSFTMTKISPRARFGLTTYIGYDYDPFFDVAPTNHYAAIFRRGLVGIGLSAPSASLHVRGSDDLSTSSALLVQNNATTPLTLLDIRNNGNTVIGTGFNWDNANGRLGIGTASPGTSIETTGAIRLSGTGTQPLEAPNATLFPVRCISGSIALRSSSGGGVSVSSSDLTPSARLHVVGSGTSNTTTALLVQNNATTPVDLFKITDNGIMSLKRSINAAGFYIDNGGEYMRGGASGNFSIGLVAAAFRGHFQINQSHENPNGDNWYFGYSTPASFSNTSTTGTNTFIGVQGQFRPTSGTAIYSQLTLYPTINQTGDASGTTRGLYVNPTLTSAFDWRSIEWSNNTGYGLYGAGTANNYLAGNTAIGTITPSARLHVRGADDLSTSSALLVQNNATTPANLLDIRNNGAIFIGKNNVTTTQNTASIEAAGADANIGIAIVPKGAGAITAQIPDGTATGGIARGDRAIDLQLSRTAATQVASGVGSICIGQNNTASSANAVVIGQSSQATTGSVAVAIGSSCQSSATYAIAIGRQSRTALLGQMSKASGIFSALGDAQTSQLSSFRSITGTAAAELTLDGGTPSAANRLILNLAGATNGRLWNAIVQLSAICITAGGTVTVGESFIGTYNLGIKRIGTTTSLVGTVQNMITPLADANMTSSVVTITADDTVNNESLKIEFTPPTGANASTVIRVVATVYLTELGY